MPNANFLHELSKNTFLDKQKQIEYIASRPALYENLKF